MHFPSEDTVFSIAMVVGSRDFAVASGTPCSTVLVEDRSEALSYSGP